MKTLHFKSNEAYLNWNKARFGKGVEKGHHWGVEIAGKKHKVMHY